jgi:hypothetical protein
MVMADVGCFGHREPSGSGPRLLRIRWRSLIDFCQALIFDREQPSLTAGPSDLRLASLKAGAPLHTAPFGADQIVVETEGRHGFVAPAVPGLDRRIA